ncbi:MAG TPA: hypothetical protein VHN37_14120 [Actinomycetota bacterium]|nr:hypothetical protein [Actinomycetota bacterium]
MTFLTRDWVHDLTVRVAGYMDEQSGGREALAFRVFDWFRLPISDAEWDSAGWNLGDIARPHVEQAMGVDLSQFDRIAMVIDQFNAGLGAWHPEGKPYLHLGAQDLTPALYQHELGHMFGAEHANLDLPPAPAEYGDRFCVMGAEGGKFSFMDPDPDHDFAAEFGTNEWRFCNQCFGLFFDGDPMNKGTCPGAAIAGTGHRAQGYDFYLRHDVPEASTEERDWRMCSRCLLLFRGPQTPQSVCPAGGTHTTTSTDHLLERDVPPGPGQPDWRLCKRCGSIFFDGYPTKGRCAAGGEHDMAAPGSEYSLAHDIRSLNETGPGMIAPTLLACGWLDLGRHGADVGTPLRARPGGTVASVRALQGAPAPGSAGPPVVLFADGLTEDRLVLEYRIRDGWDRGLPDAASGVGASAGWVLAHRTTATGRRTSLLIGEMPARPAAMVSLPDAELRVKVASVDDGGRAVTLRLDSAALPAPGDLAQKVVLPDASDFAPALCSVGNNLFLAWTGTDRRVNLALSVDGGATFPIRHVSGETSEHGPALTARGGHVHLAWTGGEGRLNVAEVVWTEPSPPTIAGLTNKVTLSDTSPHAPSVTGESGDLFLAWTGHDDALNLLISEDGGRTWAQKHTFKEFSSAAPAVEDTPEGRLHLAWKASDGEVLSAAWVDLARVGNPPVLQVNPGRPLARKSVLPDTTDHAPALVSHRGRLHVAWTGEGDSNLNLAAPIVSTAGYAKRVFATESSDAGPTVERHGRAFAMAWRGSGNLKLNVAMIRDRALLMDDFRTGRDSFLVEGGSTLTRFQDGEMRGGRRMTRSSADPPGADPGAGAQVHVGHGGLALTVGARYGAVVEVGYGWAGDGTAGPGLGLNMREGGADRICVELGAVAASVVELTVALFTPQTMYAANAFVQRGTAEFLFRDFGGGAPDLGAVSHVQLTFQVIGGHAGAVSPNNPTLRIDGIEVRA